MDTTAIVIILILVLLNGGTAILAARFHKAGTHDDFIGQPPPEPESPEPQDSHEDALLRCIARMGATPRVLAALYDADHPLTIVEIHRRFPQEDTNIPHAAIQRTLKVLLNGPFVDAVDGDLIHGRFRIRATGKSLYKAIISRGFIDHEKGKDD